MIRTAFSLLPLAMFCSAFVGRPVHGQPLGARIDAILNQAQFKQAHWGVLIVDVGSGEVLYENEADKLIVPASVTKLFTVATALDSFGPDHRFETSVYQRGSVSPTGVLDGDLILVPGGDLTLGGRTDKTGHIVFTDVDHTYANAYVLHTLTEPDPLAGLNELARQIAAAGIQHVRGDVLIDDRLFEISGTGSTRLTPVIINDNVIDIVITPGKAGSPATVDWRPKTSAIEIDAKVDTVAADSKATVAITSPSPGKIIVRGQIAEGAEPMVHIQAVEDPTAFARVLFIEALARAKITVDASPHEKPHAQLPAPETYRKDQRVALLQSPPFSEEAKLILKVSQNLHAGVLPLLIAVKNGGRTLADGLRIEHDFLKQAGVDVDTLSFADGYGASRSDYATPRATVQLLRYMAGRPDFSTYQNALPLLGVDGTLATAVAPDSPARGKVTAKTGTLHSDNTLNGNVLLTSKAVAGYMQTKSGRKIAFAIFVNNIMIPNEADSAEVGEVLGHLCEIIYGE